jgi:HK97 family phage major capsid protein/HK97 family phage prohead protease
MPPNTSEISYRTLPVDELRALDEDKLTVDLSFSSEQPIERWWGVEILDHRPGSVRLERLNDGAPLLLDHRTSNDNHVGTVLKAYLDGTKGRASVKFAGTAAAREVFDMVKEGIKKHVSVGYRVHEVVLEKQSDEGDTYRVTNWEPLEISLVSIPADITVGVGRGHSTLTAKKDRITMEITDEKLAKACRQGSYEERDRVRNIAAIIDMYPENAEIRAFGMASLRDGTILSDFQRRVVPLLSRSPRIEIDDTHLPTLAANIERDRSSALGLSQNEIRHFSILRACQAMLSGDWKHAGLELECSRAIEDRLGRAPHGLYVPSDVQKGGRWSTRAVPMDTSENSHLVGTDHLAGNFINALYPVSVAMSAGATALPGLQGNAEIPGFSAGASFAWVGEDGDSPDTEPTTKAVTLTPKTITGSVPLTRRLLKQSSPAVEMVVRNDLILGAAAAIDLAALQGTGANNQPLGITGTTGINTQTITTAGQPTWSELVAFETALGTDKALFGSLAYALNPGVMGHCKTTSKDVGSGVMLIENGMLNGYKAYSSTNVPANGIIFADWSSLLIGFWGVLDINVDTATKAKSGGYVLRAFQDLDIALRHAVSFCINTTP